LQAIIRVPEDAQAVSLRIKSLQFHRAFMWIHGVSHLLILQWAISS